MASRGHALDRPRPSGQRLPTRDAIRSALPQLRPIPPDDRVRPAVLVLAGIMALGVAPPAVANPQGLPHARFVRLGKSVEGRPIVARRVGDITSSRKALVVGNTHGDEPWSWAAARALRHKRGVHGVDIWVIDTIDPDALARGTRVNARGVDLNRNFPFRWRRVRSRGDRFYQGPRPLSEPESRIIYSLTRRLRPAVSIWYHQPYANVAVPYNRKPVALRYARLAHWPIERLPGPDYRGAINEWQNYFLPKSHAFVVEFGPSRPSAAVVRRHVSAALAVARGR